MSTWYKAARDFDSFLEDLDRMGVRLTRSTLLGTVIALSLTACALLLKS